MLRRIPLILAILFFQLCWTQQRTTMDMGQFTLSNNSSPAFLLVEESPTAIYTPENLKALVVHVLDNLGKSLSVEISPYHYIGLKSKNRTYYKYIGIERDELNNRWKQNPFSGLNTTSVSLAFVDKNFPTIDAQDRKTYSLGVRTTILRFYTKQKVIDNAEKISKILQDIVPPQEVLATGDTIKIRDWISKQQAINKLAVYKKPVQPIFKLDGSVAFTTLFKENNISSGTANRFGAWLTTQTNILLNEGEETKTNNYFKLLLTARYIEDGFNLNADEYFTTYYRDYGGKLEFEFGRFALAYEYISRNGKVDSERSVGSIKFRINKDISLNGGFGKDFNAEDNLITLFGVNWGLNISGENLRLVGDN